MSMVIEKIRLKNIKNIVVVASGKGGVGKSTVAVNLSVALARKGMKVALVDGDIYGPSVPRMFGIESSKPKVQAKENQERMIPVKRFGVKIISIGFFVTRNQSLIWRGPMVSKAIVQLIESTDWGEIDLMIIDYPPGTGDIQLTTVQKLKINGAIIVTTPQEIAINDARKAASLFTHQDIKVPILGVIENMSWFTPAEHPDEKYLIFGMNGGKTLASELNTKLIGQIPLVQEVGELAEKGRSVYDQSDSTVIKAFDDISENLLKLVATAIH